MKTRAGAVYIRNKTQDGDYRFGDGQELLLIMSVNETNSSELEALRQRIIDLEAENTKIKGES